LLAGGNKSTQAQGIKTALQLARELKGGIYDFKIKTVGLCRALKNRRRYCVISGGLL
jgi:hypothetical protein